MSGIKSLRKKKGRNSMDNNTKVYSGNNPVLWIRNKSRKMVLGIIPFLLLISILGSKGVTEEEKTVRIAVARFSHETCTFCPRPTTTEDWEFYGLLRRISSIRIVGISAALKRCVRSMEE